MMHVFTWYRRGVCILRNVFGVHMCAWVDVERESGEGVHTRTASEKASFILLHVHLIDSLKNMNAGIARRKCSSFRVSLASQAHAYILYTCAHARARTHTHTHTSDLRHAHRGSDDSEQLC